MTITLQDLSVTDAAQSDFNFEVLDSMPPTMRALINAEALLTGLAGSVVGIDSALDELHANISIVHFTSIVFERLQSLWPMTHDMATRLADSMVNNADDMEAVYGLAVRGEHNIPQLADSLLSYNAELARLQALSQVGAMAIMRKALEPFAQVAQRFDSTGNALRDARQDQAILWSASDRDYEITVAHCHAAAKALKAAGVGK